MRLGSVTRSLPILVALLAPLSAQDESHARDAGPRDQLLVVRIQRGSLGFLDLSSGRLIADLRLGKGPHEIAISSDGRTAAVPEYGGTRLFTIDVAARKLRKTIPLLRAGHKRVDGGPMPFYRPHGVSFLPGGDEVLVTAEMQKHLLRVDLREGKVVSAWPTSQRLSHMVRISEGRAFVANKTDGTVSVFSIPGASGTDARQAIEPKTVSTGGGAQGMAIHPRTGQVWVANIFDNTISILDSQGAREIDEFPCGVYPVRIAFTPNGKRALVSNYQPGTVSIFDTKTRKSIGEIELPRLSKPQIAKRPLPPHRAGFDTSTPLPVGLIVSPRGDVGYVSCTRADLVCEIDIAKIEIRRTFEVPGEPDGLAFVPTR